MLKAVQLITSKKDDGCFEVALCMQFENIMATASLNSNIWRIWTKPNEMIQQYMLRVHKCIYFATKDSFGDAIC